MAHCTHMPFLGTPRVRMELAAEEPGRALYALACRSCGFVVDAKWLPAGTGSLARHRTLLAPCCEDALARAEPWAC